MGARPQPNERKPKEALVCGVNLKRRCFTLFLEMGEYAHYHFNKKQIPCHCHCPHLLFNILTEVMFNKIQKTKSFKEDYTLFKLLTFTIQHGSCRLFTPTSLLSDWNHVIDINVINGLPVYPYACIKWWIKYFLHIWGLWSKSQSTEAILVHIILHYFLNQYFVKTLRS